VTLAALITRNQQAEMAEYVGLALDNGVKASEISEIITHLAFYAGWGNARAAVAITKDVFAARKIGEDQLASGSPTPLPLNEAVEADRAKRVVDLFGAVFRASRSTRLACCSAISGFGLPSHRATAALSRLVHWWRPVRSRS
jgi:4-carboxymuconolactone decarboxylase